MKKINDLCGIGFDKLSEKFKKENSVSKYNKDPNTLSGLRLPNNLVAMPHYFSQTSIYAPRSGDRKSITKREDLWSQGGMNLSYEGPPLDTKIDIQLMSLVLKAKDLQIEKSNIITLKYKETMRSLGLNPHHPNSRIKFTSSLNRHLEAKLFFSIGNEEAGFWKNFFVAEGTVFDYKKNILHIQISDVIQTIFKLKDSGSFSIENMLINFALKSSYASKLYSYYESNNVPFPIKVSTILKICDKKIEDKKKPTNNHRRIIMIALDELVSVRFLSSWHFDSSNSKRDPLIVVSKRKRSDTAKSSNLKFEMKYIDT